MQRLQRLTDRALAIPLAGFVLLMPPLLPLFARPVSVLGVPLLVVYVFGVWLLLILAGRWAARALRAAADASETVEQDHRRDHRAREAQARDADEAGEPC